MTPQANHIFYLYFCHVTKEIQLKKKITLFFLSLLLIVLHAHELNFFQTNNSSKLVKCISKTKEHIYSPIDHIISSFELETMIDMYSGDARVGYTLFKKNFERLCQLSPLEFAIVHTQDEWESIVESGQFYKEMLELCPKVENILETSWLPSLYLFVYEYAIDSDNIPPEEEQYAQK